MPRYSINLYNFAWNDETDKRQQAFDEVLANPFILNHTLETKNRTSFEATVSVEAENLKRALRMTGDLLRTKDIHAGFKTWTGWYPADVIRCARRRLEAEYTPEEIATPDTVLTASLPSIDLVDVLGETTTIIDMDSDEVKDFIKATRKRHRMLVRYKLAMEFATANPNISFQSPKGGITGGGISILRVEDSAIGITFSAVRNRMHVKGAYANEWIMANDSHRFQALIEADGQALAANSPGNPAILHDIESQPELASPALTAWQAEYQAEREASRAERDEAHAVFYQADQAFDQHMAEWRAAHPRPAGEDEDIPF